MIFNKRFIPLILAAGFISSSAFAQSAKTNTAEQEAARVEIKQLTQRIQELAKKLGPDSGVQIHIIDAEDGGKTIERHVIRQGGPDSGLHMTSPRSAQEGPALTPEQKAIMAQIGKKHDEIKALSKKLGPDLRANINLTITDVKSEMQSIESLRKTLGATVPKWHGDSNKHIQRIDVQTRAGLGIVMAPHSAAGVKLAAVSPNSAAQKAGLKAGDIITAINGKKLSAKEAAGLEQARAALGKPKLGESVKIAYSRAGKAGSVTVKAASIAPEMIINRDSRMAPRQNQAFTFATRWNGLHMADMNEQLGRYFGVNSGVLVLSPKSEFATLQAGDVLTKIDGKPVNRSRDVMAAMKGKKAGDKFDVEVMRDRKPVRLSLTAPKTRAFNLPPMPPPPPAPPAPPAVPKKGGIAPPPPPAPPAPPRIAFFASDDHFTALELSTDGMIRQNFDSGLLEVEGVEIRMLPVSEQ